VAAGSIIRSQIPDGTLCGPPCYLIKDSPSSHPGIPVAQSVIDVGGGVISSNRRNVISQNIISADIPDYNFFESKIPSEVLANDGFDIYIRDLPSRSPADLLYRAVEYGGYRWIRIVGDPTNNIFSLTPIIPPNPNYKLQERLIIFVKNADLSINTPLKIDRKRGGYYFIVQGDGNENSPAVRIDPNVGASPPYHQGDDPDIEAIFFVDGTFDSGTTPQQDDDNQLYIRGSVFAQSFSLQRDLFNNSQYPAEIFEFAPDLLFTWPPSLTRKKIIWRETTP